MGLPLYILSLSSKAMANYEGFSPILTKYIALAVLGAAICAVPLDWLWKKLPAWQGHPAGTPIIVPDWLAFPIWAWAGFQYRYDCFQIIQPYLQMQYDFAAALESARGFYQAKEAIFTHWAYYPRLLYMWFVHTHDNSYQNAAYFNFIVCGLVVAMVYVLARLVCKRQRCAMMAAGIACFWPSFAYYSCVTTNEHFAMLMMLFTSVFAIAGVKLAMASAKEEAKSNVYFTPAVLKILAISFLLGAGVSAALSDLFKQFSPVFYIASFAVCLVFFLMEKPPVNRLIAIILAFAMMFAATTATKTYARHWLENYLGEPVAKSATAHFLWIGLNSKGGGEWSAEEGMKVYELAEQYNNDYDKVMEELMALLKADLAENKDKLPDTIKHKMEKDWAADTGIMLWLKAMYNDVQAWMDDNDGADPTWVPREEKDLYDFDPVNDITKNSAALYMAVMGLIAVGGFAAVFRRKPEEMYLRLVFFGYALLFILSEAQGRYQVVLFPIFAVLAACAGEQIGGLFRLKKKEAEH